MPISTKNVMGFASSKPVSGTISTNGVSEVFDPELNRGMYLTLAGTWVGTVQVERSVDGGQTWSSTTIAGGQPWMLYTTNCDEVIDVPTDSNGKFRLKFTLSSGAAIYRLAQ